MTSSISALVISYNESSIISRCLNSLIWADEIVVIDAESTDTTPLICNDPQAPWAGKIRFYTRKWTGFKDQRNFCLEKAKNDWVFVIDSDEECSPELAKKMQEIVNQSAPSDSHHRIPQAYKVKRQEYFLKKPIHFGVWNPSYQDRFFKKSGVYYKNDIHEYPIFLEPPQRIHEPIHHDPSFNPERFLNKMNRYTSIEAMDRVKNGQRTHLIHLIGAGPAMFLKNYFYYQSYKDGKHGLIISLLEGLSRTVRHIKIWQYGKDYDRKKEDQK